MGRNLITLLALLWSLPVKSQFTDSFQDGSLLSNPVWVFTSGNFEILNGRLHTTNSNGGAIQYGISSRFEGAFQESYEFHFEIQANPSSSNYIDFFISADSFAEVALNGYFIRLGDLKDEISLYRLINGTKTELISGVDGELNKTSNKYKVLLLRDSTSNWRLVYENLSSGNRDTAGSVLDTSFRKHDRFTGIKVVQNGTGIIGKHYFDNIRFGTEIRDTTPPRMKSAVVIFPNQIQVTFDEEILKTTESDYHLSGIGNPALASIHMADAHIVNLSFASAFSKNGTYILQNSETSDLSGNLSRQNYLSIRTLFTEPPVKGDIIITELMANPSPGVGNIPEFEYLEIKNMGSKFLELKNCQLSDGSSTAVLPDSILKPYSYAILCRNTSTGFQPTEGIWVGTNTFPGLNNDADALSLFNASGDLLTSLNYSENWHSDPIKKLGGWSLEIIDTTYFCISEGNWKSNNSKGGTPGGSNSTFAPLAPLPEFYPVRSYAVNDRTLRIYFSFNPDSSKLSQSMFEESYSGSQPAAIQNFNYGAHSCDLVFDSKFLPNQIYKLIVKDAVSCFGSTSGFAELPFGIANMHAAVGDIYISEILPNPPGNNAEYIELFNNSNKILDLKNILIASLDETGNPKDARIISAEGGSWFPKSYIWLSKAPEANYRYYLNSDSQNAITMDQMPNLGNEEGNIAVYNTLSEKLDVLFYLDDFHSPVISDNKGVSLEKTMIIAETNSKENWTSAASSVGYGTPGKENSQTITMHQTMDFHIAEGFFSPDGDGATDLLQIAYHMETPGYFLSAKIFGENGALIASPFNNYSIASSGVLIWNGDTGNGVITPGNYVMILQGFHNSGKTFDRKLQFTVLRNQ